MTTPDGTDIFYGSIPVFRGFGRLMDPAMYAPLPDDWTVGVADIVESTKAIANQRYKAVNMAGAAVIAAVTNALENREFPFVFGGDGASFAVAPADLVRAREALAATAAYRGGTGTLDAVLEARVDEIDTRLDHLMLEMETAELWAEINYLVPIAHNAGAHE